MMKKIEKIFDNIIFRFIFGSLRTVVYGCLIIYVAFICCQKISNNSSIMGYRVFNIASGSMIPVYNINDIILVKDVDVNKLEVGDDITYKGTRGGFENLTVTHRIIKVDKTDGVSETFTTQGVNNEESDPIITKDQILGKVVGKLPVINGINHVVKNNYGLFFLVFCPLVVVLCMEVFSAIIEYQIDKNYIRKITNK